jgi:hypothetical protein
MKCNAIILSIIAFFCTTPLLAQNDKPGYINPEDREVDMDNPTFVPMVKVGKVLLGGDSVQYVELKQHICLSAARIQRCSTAAGFQPTGLQCEKGAAHRQRVQPDHP